MTSQVKTKIKVADEVWVATALLHIESPRREDFDVHEIVKRAQGESAAALRPGVYVHVLQHCVANRAPNPGRYRMLMETREGRRRLYRTGDSYHPARDGGKTIPSKEELPAEYHNLIDWYHEKYDTRRPEKKRAGDSILELRGLGKGLWRDEDPDSYIRRLREGWE